MTMPDAKTLVLAAYALGVARLVGLVAWVSAAPERNIGRIPDDAFYYLTMARHFAHSGHWTFDGSAPATGFQLLHGYTLAGIARLGPSDNAFVSLAVMLGAAALIPALAIGGWITRSASAPMGATIALLVWLPNIAINIPAAMEWGWVVSAGAMLVVAAMVGWPIWAVFALGVVGSLARIDFAILPIMMTVVGIIHRPMLRPALFGVAGAAIGIAIVSAHCWFVSGEWVQSSVQVKAIWSVRGWRSFQVWHTAPLLVPALLVVLAVVSRLSAKVHGLAVVFALALCVWFAPAPAARWPHQEEMLAASRAVSDFDGRIGAWNAGIIGYYSGGRVVNLDGLVNCDVIEFIRVDRIDQYVLDIGIDYIADFPSMLSRDYSGATTVVPMLRQVMTIDENRGGWSGMTIWKVLR